MNHGRRGLSVILVSYDARGPLERCLRSLSTCLAQIPHEIILVDNASRDGTAEMVEGTFPEVRLIRNRENLGYPKANNQGVAVAAGELFLFLNPDTEVLPGACDRLLAELLARPRAGAVAPILRLPSGRIEISFGRSVHFLSESLKKLLLNRYLARRAERYEEAREMGWLGGACLLTRRHVLELTGGFDEEFFLYFEDIDLSYRIRDLGFELYLVPEAEILHVGGASTSSSRLLARYHYRRSQLRFYGKHASRMSRWCLKCYLWLNFQAFYWRARCSRAADVDSRKRFFGLLRER